MNNFHISGKILITCRELYFEVVGHVYLIIMGYFPENEIFFLSKIMSKMTHILNKNKNNCFQILLQTVLLVKQMIRSCIIFQWYFCETLYKTSDCYVCSYYLSSVLVAEWPPFGKELLTRLTICYLCILTIIILVISQFSFVGRIWNLIDSVSGLCILFTFIKRKYAVLDF